MKEGNMLPEAAEAIRIADKHLPDGTNERRSALARDIVAAINIHASSIAMEAISAALAAYKVANLRAKG